MIKTNLLNNAVSQWIDILVNHAMHNQVRYVKAAGLSMPQFAILMHLFYRQTCGISQVSNHMEITAAAASQLVDKLVQSGLVERLENPDDRRARLVKLSARGMAIIEEGIIERSRWADQLIRGMNAADRETVGHALEILGNAIKKMNTFG